MRILIHFYLYKNFIILCIFIYIKMLQQFIATLLSSKYTSTSKIFFLICTKIFFIFLFKIYILIYKIRHMKNRKIFFTIIRVFYSF